MKTIKEYSELDNDLVLLEDEATDSPLSAASITEEVVTMVDDIYETVLNMEEVNSTVVALINRLYSAVDDVYTEIDKHCGVTPAAYDDFEEDEFDQD